MSKKGRSEEAILRTLREVGIRVSPRNSGAPQHRHARELPGARARRKESGQ